MAIDSAETSVINNIRQLIAESRAGDVCPTSCAEVLLIVRIWRTRNRLPFPVLLVLFEISALPPHPQN